jgi:hypothetical protein
VFGLQNKELTVFEDIFEAIRYLESRNIVISIKDNASGYLQRNLYFNTMELPDGTVGAFPPNMTSRFYRGENKVYENCYPSIFRVNNATEACRNGNRRQDNIVIDTLKIIDFELVIKNFPQVQFAIKDYCNVDYSALAQHYELNTNLIDLTCDLAVAAFFATNYYNAETQEYEIKEFGMGCLRSYVNIAINYEQKQPFRLIGLQPFKRPGLQCAFALKLEAGEDFANHSAKVLFKQNPQYNGKLREAFYDGDRNILFPKEDITDIANMIKTKMSVSQEAVKLYCNEQSVPEPAIFDMLERNNITVTDNIAYKLTRQNRRRLERVYKDRPYGDVKLISRLSYLPQYNSVEK